MAQAYSFIGSEQVTEILGPTISQQVQEVTAQAVKSGVVFVARFPPELYIYPNEVQLGLNQLAERFDEWSAIPGVTSIATGQDLTPSNQLHDYTEITVTSTSGKSSDSFRWVYPVGEFQTIQPLLDKVKAVRKMLDAVEGA